jgi:hypothetical protein
MLCFTTCSFAGCSSGSCLPECLIPHPGWDFPTLAPDRMYCLCTAAASVEKDVASFGYALAEAAFGGIGLFVAALWDVVSRLASLPSTITLNCGL